MRTMMMLAGLALLPSLAQADPVQGNAYIAPPQPHRGPKPQHVDIEPRRPARVKDVMIRICQGCMPGDAGAAPASMFHVNMAREAGL